MNRTFFIGNSILNILSLDNFLGGKKINNKTYGEIRKTNFGGT